MAVRRASHLHASRAPHAGPMGPSLCAPGMREGAETCSAAVRYGLERLTTRRPSLADSENVWQVGLLVLRTHLQHRTGPWRQRLGHQCCRLSVLHFHSLSLRGAALTGFGILGSVGTVTGVAPEIRQSDQQHNFPPSRPMRSRCCQHGPLYPLLKRRHRLPAALPTGRNPRSPMAASAKRSPRLTQDWTPCCIAR